MGTDAPTIVFIPVHCAPKKAPCPKCGKLGKRKRTCTREVRTVAFKAVAYLKASRFVVRRGLVIDEANAIGTT